MITINDKEYKNFEIEITWSKIAAVCDAQKITGPAPFITFFVDKFIIGLELIHTKEMFETMKKGIKKDIKKYISDITFEDEKGWISINNGPFQCHIIKKDDKTFNIDFEIDTYDLDEEFKICIKEDIRLFK